MDAGRHIRRTLDTYHGAEPYYLYFYISPYTRSLQTYLGIRSAFPDDRTIGVQEEVQLREQVGGESYRAVSVLLLGLRIGSHKLLQCLLFVACFLWERLGSYVDAVCKSM